MSQQSFIDHVTNLVRSAHPSISITTSLEFERVWRDIQIIATRLAPKGKKSRSVYAWDSTRGLWHVEADPRSEGDGWSVVDKFDDTFDLVGAAKWVFDAVERGVEEIAEEERTRRTIDVNAGGRTMGQRQGGSGKAPVIRDALIVIKSIHYWVERLDPMGKQLIVDLVRLAPQAGCSVLFIGGAFVPDPALPCRVVEYTLPTDDDISRVVKAYGGEPTSEIVRALSGLAMVEVENAISLSLVETKKIDPLVILREKTSTVNRTGLLSLEPEPDAGKSMLEGLALVGGFDNLKRWLMVRTDVFTEEARAYGVPALKGILVSGVPGTGKSQLAKCVGWALRCPTLRLDFSAMFNSLVGQSEQQLRDTLQLAERMSPCILLIDEIDKGLAGTAGSGSNDSGVGKRLLGILLSWMQDHKGQVFVIATANEVRDLPPELLRKGRFDEIFAIDLPGRRDREDILKIHLKKRGRDPEKFDTAAVANVTDTFTGSEIEFVVIDALINAFADKRREVTTDDLVLAATATVPLAKISAEKVEAVRAWARTSARWASTPESEIREMKTGGVRRLGGDL